MNALWAKSTLVVCLVFFCFPRALAVKDLPAGAGATGVTGLIPGLGRFPRVGNGNPRQYSCLENSMDRGAWWATVHAIAESDTNEHKQTTATY